MANRWAIAGLSPGANQQLQGQDQGQGQSQSLGGEALQQQSPDLVPALVLVPALALVLVPALATAVCPPLQNSGHGHGHGHGHDLVLYLRMHCGQLRDLRVGQSLHPEAGKYL